MMKTLRFGGPKLPVGTHTFYTTADGSRELRAEVGDEVQFDAIMNGQHYIDSELASIIVVPVTKTKKEE